MITVIIAGGAGTRLWPLSTPDYPKHLLKLNGDKKSLLQNTYNRAELLSKKIYIVSDASHIEHVKKQLANLNDRSFIVEPARRGTASCILAALVRISNDNNNPTEPVIFLSADHYIRDMTGFKNSFLLASEISKKYSQITLVGIEPEYAATGFGYIKKGEVLKDYSFAYNVDMFKEKPDHLTAQNYFKSGNYLWNSGYFVGSVNTFLEAMKNYNPSLYDNYVLLRSSTSNSYESVYLDLDNISIDYALIEKIKNLVVLPGTFDWLDLGSYADFSKAVGFDEKGNKLQGFVITEEVSNSYIHNEEDKPIAVIGLDNCVVINSPNGILITRKDLSQKVGEVSKRIANK